MPLHKYCRKKRAMTAHDAIGAADIRAAFPNHTMKQLARALGAPIDTARALLYRGVWPSRRREVALAIIAELDKQDAERARVRARVESMLEEYGAALVQLAPSKSTTKQSTKPHKTGALAARSSHAAK